MGTSPHLTLSTASYKYITTFLSPRVRSSPPTDRVPHIQSIESVQLRCTSPTWQTNPKTQHRCPPTPPSHQHPHQRQAQHQQAAMEQQQVKARKCPRKAPKRPKQKPKRRPRKHAKPLSAKPSPPPLHLPRPSTTPK